MKNGFLSIILSSLFLFSNISFASELNMYKLDIKVENASSSLGRIFFAYVDGDLARNYDDKGEKVEILWKTESGLILSNKVYLYENSIFMSKVKFCIKQYKNEICSDYIVVNNQKVKSKRENVASISIDVKRFSFYEDMYPMSSTVFDIDNGSASFLYMEYLDQDEKVIENKIEYGVIKSDFIGSNRLTSKITKLKVCAVGGFVKSEPTSIETCTDSYSTVRSNVKLGCIYQGISWSGNQICYGEGNSDIDLLLPYEWFNSVSSIKINDGYRMSLATDNSGRFNSKTKYKSYNKDISYFGHEFNDSFDFALIENDDSAACLWDSSKFSGNKFCIPKVMNGMEILLPEYMRYKTSSITLSPDYKIKIKGRVGVSILNDPISLPTSLYRLFNDDIYSVYVLKK